MPAKKFVYILGIACDYHHSSACLLRNGVVIAAASEERFTRKKHDESFPENAIQFCFDYANITLEQVDHVVFYEKPILKFERLLQTYIHGKNRATGVIMLDLSTGERVFESDPSLEILQKWVKTYHNPFHKSLVLACKTADFLIDAHSMWSKSVAGHWGAEEVGKPRADILIGNKYFTSADGETTQFFIQYFEKLGYNVSLNDPYPGRFVLGAYCQRDHLPGIQIEINRRLYLDEETLEPYPEKITQLNQELQGLVTELIPWFKNHKQSKLVDMS